MTRTNTIIFDLDGTLIHSAPDLQAATNHALGLVGRPPLDLGTVVSFIGNGVEKLVARALVATGSAPPELQQETLVHFLAYYETHSVDLTRPYPGVVAFLEGLKQRGIIMGLCTNKPTAPARDICAALDLAGYFDVILGAEPDRAKKPDPAPLQACCDMLGVEASGAVYIGDSAVDHLTAARAGIKFGLFTEGYLNTPLPVPDPDLKFSDWDDPRLFAFCTQEPTHKPGHSPVN
ncbi:Phosphoglycolate phosphatase, chromosomal [Roseobacter fucihabitans]|uniref:phosphoglycolate phosphatase n=1 Tax=Roseobacter fucihabitans TaxID=1537242 RepID=A0ABZ2BPI5_9RHOB|nr:phosphoglycolate phosphatase [Roseobacter litoralis]MBC6967914.1 Phosphoglycolate phosphatase, chromosomal [Roseobacter litoralis]